MKKVAIAMVCLVLIAGTTSCKNKEAEEKITDLTETEKTNDATSETITVTMNAKSGSNVTGTITLTQNNDEVNMVVDLNGLTPGDHAIHVHQVGDCSSEDGSSAGGHWNPKEENHGKWGDDMHHAGDIGNLVASADGKATLTFSTDQWCLGCDDDTKNLKGKSFIVHADADDYSTQPTGNAGGRVACGVIE